MKLLHLNWIANGFDCTINEKEQTIRNDILYLLIITCFEFEFHFYFIVNKMCLFSIDMQMIIRGIRLMITKKKERIQQGATFFASISPFRQRNCMGEC